jgi:hypothetical protein
VPERKVAILQLSVAADAQSLNYYRSKWWRLIVNYILAAISQKLDLTLR